MLAVFLKDLRLILRDRYYLIGSLLVPVALISLVSAALFSSPEGPRLTVAVVDEDRGPVAAELKQALAASADLVEVDRGGAEAFVRGGNRGPAAVVFPAGLSENFRRGVPTEIPLVTDPAQAGNLEALRVLLLAMEERAAMAADPLAERMIVLKEQNLTGSRLAVSPFEQNLPGFALMFVLFAVILGTALGLYEENDRGTLPRLLVAPTRFAGIVLGKLGARCVLGTVQMVVLLAWVHFAFGVSLGKSPAALLAVSVAVVVATAATGLLVAGLASTRDQAQPIGLAMVIVLSGLGGLWWPQAMSPEWLAKLAPAVYTGWAMRGLNDLVLRDRGWAAIAAPLAMIALYGAVTMTLGLWLFRARHGRQR